MVNELKMVDSYPITLENFGLASLSDLFDDRVIYRSLEPVDRRLSGLKSARYQLGLNDSQIPRKLDNAYAKVALFILEKAQERRRADLNEIVLIGDTKSGDGQAFTNLRDMSKRPGTAFIGNEKADRPVDNEPDAAAGILYANRWTALADWAAWSLEQGLKFDKNTAVIVDIDKTALGARGRNDRTIDAARLKGLYQAAQGILDERFNARLFEEHYDALNRSRYHIITEDNQDYLAYICLILNAGLVECDDLMERMERGSLNSFPHFVRWVETMMMQGGISERVRQVHEAVHTSVQNGDPTPFKSFRRHEFLATLEAMNNLPDDATVEERLSREITITQEVYEVSQWLEARGCLVISLSDKPDEASVPSRLQQREYPSIHKAQTHRVGVSIKDRLTALD
jgi:hypothetical protein